MKRILVTRSARKTEPLARALEPHHVQVAALPVTETIWLRTPAPSLNTIRWVVITSAEAVNGLLRRTAEWRDRLPQGVRFAALGYGTAEAARSLLNLPLELVTGRTGSELARALLETDPTPGTILWPCAETVAGGLEEELEPSGAQLIRWPLYRIQPRLSGVIWENVLQVGSFDALLFAAPSGVTAWANAMTDPWQQPCIAIGPTTAEALWQAGARNITEAITPDTPGMTDAVLTVLDRVMRPLNKEMIHHD